VRLKHQQAREAAHPVDVGKPLTRGPRRDGNLLGHDRALHYRSLSSSRQSVAQRGAQISPLACIGLWAALSFLATLYAVHLGYDGRAFVATLVTFAFLLAVILFCASRGFSEKLLARFGAATGYLLGAAAYISYLVYAVGTGTFTLVRAGEAAAFAFVPLLLAASAKNAAPGAWQDFASVAGIWVVVKFYGARLLWPYPEGRGGYILTVLFALAIGLSAFLFARRIGGIGYTIGWGRHWGWFVLASFLVFCVIAIPLGEAIHFVRFDPHVRPWRTLPGTALGILVFTAWPEEFLFRGILQNLLQRAMKSELAGWLAASVVFGFAHITNMGFPNWRYVILATIAGVFYGWTWRKSGSIFASALVHMLVDTAWHFLFWTV
jgi:membrane protease YdiL (CAAX protease family)